MRHFMIWPILVPAIALCHDAAAAECCDAPFRSEGSWNTSDHDNFLTEAPRDLSIHVDGTITEEGGDCIYDEPYDMNAR
jgi:hypothetical protein